MGNNGSKKEKIGKQPIVVKIGNTFPKFLLGERHENCIICLEDYEEDSNVCILTCTHSFHMDCIYDWATKQLSCPVCRQRIPLWRFNPNTSTSGGLTGNNSTSGGLTGNNSTSGGLTGNHDVCVN